VFQTPPAEKINFENTTTHQNKKTDGKIWNTGSRSSVLLFSPKSRQWTDFYMPPSHSLLPKTQRQSEWVPPDHVVLVSPKVQYSRRGFRIFTLTNYTIIPRAWIWGGRSALIYLRWTVPNHCECPPYLTGEKMSIFTPIAVDIQKTCGFVAFISLSLSLLTLCPCNIH
jgi:hypothetical protein